MLCIIVYPSVSLDPNCELSWGKDLCCVLLGNLRAHNRCLLYVLGLKHTHTHTHTQHSLSLSLLAHPTSPKSKWTGFFKSKYRLMVRWVHMYLWDKRMDSEICLGKSRMWNQPSHPHDSITGEGHAYRQKNQRTAGTSGVAGEMPDGTPCKGDSLSAFTDAAPKQVTQPHHRSKWQDYKELHTVLENNNEHKPHFILSTSLLQNKNQHHLHWLVSSSTGYKYMQRGWTEGWVAWMGTLDTYHKFGAGSDCWPWGAGSCRLFHSLLFSRSGCTLLWVWRKGLLL